MHTQGSANTSPSRIYDVDHSLPYASFSKSDYIAHHDGDNGRHAAASYTGQQLPNDQSKCHHVFYQYGTLEAISSFIFLARPQKRQPMANTA